MFRSGCVPQLTVSPISRGALCVRVSRRSRAEWSSGHQLASFSLPLSYTGRRSRVRVDGKPCVRPALPAPDSRLIPPQPLSQLMHLQLMHLSGLEMKKKIGFHTLHLLSNWIL